MYTHVLVVFLVPEILVSTLVCLTYSDIYRHYFVEFFDPGILLFMEEQRQRRGRRTPAARVYTVVNPIYLRLVYHGYLQSLIQYI